MGHAGQKNTLSSKIDRPEFGMGLHEKSILAQRQLIDVGQGCIIARNNGRGQHYEVSTNNDIVTQDVIPDSHGNPSITFLNFRFGFRVVSNKNNPAHPRFSVKFLSLPIGANVPVKDIYIHFRVHFLQF